jgi:hypothetical protein
MSADDEDNTDDDPDLPLESDMDDSDEPDLMPCPFCRQMITEDHEICPHCRNFISPADAPRQTPVWLLIVAGLAIIAILIVWVARTP